MLLYLCRSSDAAIVCSRTGQFHSVMSSASPEACSQLTLAESLLPAIPAPFQCTTGTIDTRGSALQLRSMMLSTAVLCCHCWLLLRRGGGRTCACVALQQRPSSQNISNQTRRCEEVALRIIVCMAKHSTHQLQHLLPVIQMHQCDRAQRVCNSCCHVRGIQHLGHNACTLRTAPPEGFCIESIAKSACCGSMDPAC